MNALSKALKFYDMGFNPRGESLEEFIEECNQRMDLIEELYKDPKSYLEKKYGISSDISLVDQKIAARANKILNEKYGLNLPHPILKSEKDFQKIIYKLGTYPLPIRFLDKLFSIFPYERASGTIIKINGNNTSVVCPILDGVSSKYSGSCVHEQFHVARFDIETGFGSINPKHWLERVYSRCEGEYLAYVDEGIKIKDIGLMYGFNSFSIIGSYTALANLISRPRLMSAPIELLSETLKLTLPFVAEIEILFYSVAQYTEKFRKNARREGLNPDYILTKASAIEIGTKNIKEKIEKKKGLRWELLRKKLHTCSSTTSLSLSK